MARKAVLCGINNYESQTDLRGCVNDVNDMYQLLIQKFNYKPEEIHKLVDRQVTKTAIEHEWKWLLNGAKAGDYLVFHFSGHGSYITDDNNDENDGFDEITCLYDMDFHKPDTFIRDDEWNGMTRQIPEGVHVTLVLDTCHSGSGTRMLPVNLREHYQTMAVDLETSSQRRAAHAGRFLAPEESSNLRILESQTATLSVLNQQDYQKIVGDHDIVLPRFLPPPPDLQERMVAKARTTGLRSDRTHVVDNHLLLAACRDDQTAADAFIDNDFHGAFTYYLCKTLQQNPQMGSTELIRTVKRSLRSNQFSQIPQHEGIDRRDSVFGASSAGGNGGSEPNLPDTPESPDNGSIEMPPSPMRAGSGLTPDNQRLLIEAYMKLLDTLSGTAEPTRDLPTQRWTGNRYLVCVHGIGQHGARYSNPWWNSLKPHVGQSFGSGNLDESRREVIWSDLVNARALVDDAERERLRREIMAVLEERRQQMIVANTGGGSDARRAIIQSRHAERSFAIDDFLVYMLDDTMRQRIIKRFTDVVKPLLEANNQIDVIAHSWGTVVAYEGLRELETNRSLPGRVSNFFTVGSALSILPVRTSLRKSNQDGRSPTNVDRWINIDAKGDLVGGMVGDMFDITQEFLELEPIGCSRGLFGYSLSCAHSSYFNSNNTKVNRDIFAKFMLD